jgi:hypothetical protein
MNNFISEQVVCAQTFPLIELQFRDLVERCGENTLLPGGFAVDWDFKEGFVMMNLLKLLIMVLKIEK